MSQEIAVQETNSRAVSANTEEIKRNITAVKGMMGDILIQGSHYGKIPGCGDRPALYKSGAEHLLNAFNIGVDIDVDRDDLANGHREYIITAHAVNRATGQRIGAGVGSASTMESKHRYRNQWVDGKKIKVENPDPADQYNTVLKMAKKRAVVDLALTTLGVSDLFTQDIEDIIAPDLATPGTLMAVRAMRDLMGVDDKKYANQLKACMGKAIESDELLTVEAADALLAGYAKQIAKMGEPKAEQSVGGSHE